MRLALRTQVSSLVPEGSKKRKSCPASRNIIGNRCSEMFLSVSALLKNEAVSLPSSRLKLTLQQSPTKLYFLPFDLYFFKFLGYINPCKLLSQILLVPCEAQTAIPQLRF